MAKAGFVYVIVGVEPTLLKIGNSTDPHKRAYALTRELGFECKVLYTTGELPDCAAVERVAHILLLGDRKLVIGEWFAVNLDEAMSAIEKAIRVASGKEYAQGMMRYAMDYNLELRHEGFEKYYNRRADMIRSGEDNLAGVRNDADLLELWLHLIKNDNTRRYYKRAAELFLDFIYRNYNGLTFKTVRISHVIAFEQQLEKQMGNSSARTMMAALRSLFKFAERADFVEKSVAHVMKLTPRAETPVNKVLTEQEVLAIIREAGSERNRVLLEFLYASGARAREAFKLQHEHIQVIDGHAHITLQGKGGKTRVIKLAKGITERLTALRTIDTVPADAVFHTRPDGCLEHPYKPMSVEAMRDILLNAARRAGITRPVSPHWLRHSHGTHADRKGKNLVAIQDALGHSDPRTTRRYVQANHGVMLGDDFITEQEDNRTALSAWADRDKSRSPLLSADFITERD